MSLMYEIKTYLSLNFVPQTELEMLPIPKGWGARAGCFWLLGAGAA